MNEPYLNSLSVSPDFIDLRPRIDDKTILRNPHKGWYMHYIDNGLTRRIYRDGIPAGDHLENFPGMHHLYLRMDWADLEKEEGKMDFTELDAIFSEWAPFGYRFAFRLCCFVRGGNPYSTPKWVREAGAKGTELPLQSGPGFDAPKGEIAWEPDYGDPIFLEKLESFLKRFGEKYNGHPLVEFVDIGTFGTWGEGHTSGGTEKRYSADVLRRHVDLHLKYLPDTQLLLNDDMVNTAFLGGESTFGRDGTESALRFAAYCAGKGIGLRDDSVCVKYYSQMFGYDTLRTGYLFDLFSPTAPVDLEFEHYNRVSPEGFKDGYAFLEALKRTHASFAGFHGYPQEWLKTRSAFTEYAANRLGYWYFFTGLDLPECVSGMKTLARLNVENRGWAPAYHPFELKVQAVCGEKRYLLFKAEGKNLRWQTQCTEILPLSFVGVPAGKYELEIGLFEKDQPIQLAIQAQYQDQGYYRLCTFSVKEG